MALNSTFVINRMGAATCDAGSRSVIEPMDETYTASRLGLTFVRRDQSICEPPRSPEPAQQRLQHSDALDSRLGISSQREADRVGSHAHEPFWPKFRHAAAVLAIAVKDGIIGKLKPPSRPAEQFATAEDHASDSLGWPSMEGDDDQDQVVYRKGTYKMPEELITRLRRCAEISHRYQYRLVMQSLDEFLTAEGFARDSQDDDCQDQDPVT